MDWRDRTIHKIVRALNNVDPIDVTIEKSARACARAMVGLRKI